MIRGRKFISGLFVGAASITLAIGGNAAPVAAQSPADSFRIEGQPLGQALMHLSRQANVDIVAPAKVTRGRSAKAVSADTVEDALRQMLAGSGLTFKKLGTRYLIQAGNVAGPAPVNNAAWAQLAGAEARQIRFGKSIVEGAITDEATGAALKGALVEVVETGETAKTDDTGKYRLNRVPATEVTLRISYLGYSQITNAVSAASGATVRANFSMRAGEGSDIVVYASRSSRAQSLNQERAAENSSTVVSSDLLGDFGGQTISETLRRAPGVTFDRDPNTNEGTNISIRGLEPNLNAVKLNGIELPVGSGKGRSALLGNIQTESIDKVTIHKTLMANQDSSGAGGLVEIETKSPLDRKRRFASASIEGAKRGRGFNQEFSASGTISARFGASEKFGLSASAQYQERTVRRLGTGITDIDYGEYLPLQVDGTPIPGIDFVDPRIEFPFEDGGKRAFIEGVTANSDLTTSTQLTVTLSAAWEPATHTRLRLDYQRARLTQERLARNVRLGARNEYVVQPVAALSGEERAALQWTGGLASGSSYGYRPSDHSDTDVLTLRGESDFGRLETKYSVGYTIGKSDSLAYGLSASGRLTDSVDPAFIRNDLAVDSVENRIISLFATQRGFAPAVPALTDAGLTFYNDPAAYTLFSADENFEKGRNSRLAGDFSLKYNLPAGPLRYIEIGGQYERSQFTSTNPYTTYYYVPEALARPLAFYGVNFDDGILRPIGIDNRFSAMSLQAFRDFVVNRLPEYTLGADDPRAGQPGYFFAGTVLPNPLILQAATREAELVGFAQARLDIGKLEIIGGARFSQVQIDTRNLRTARIYDQNYVEDVAFTAANTQLFEMGAKQFNILPRLLINYRFSDNLVLRSGYFLSVARPQVTFLSNVSEPFLLLDPAYGPFGNKPLLQLNSGNPDLKPAYTHSFDVGLEYYSESVGVAKISFFYKRIKNLLENNNREVLDSVEGVELPDDPRFQDIRDNPENYFISLNVPQNNPSAAHIWGMEATLERQLKFLPGALSGLGVFANYTYSDSSKEQPYDWYLRPLLDGDGNIIGYDQERFILSDQPFDNSSKHSGTVGLSYSKYGVDARVSYTMQSSRRPTFFANGRTGSYAGFETLDARLEYRIPSSLVANGRIFVEGYDLLRGAKDPGAYTKVLGVVTEAQYFGGRQIRFGVSANF